jgi:hypothetical protein
MITLNLPVAPEDVKAEVARLTAELARVRQEERALCGLLKVLQGQCTHKNTFKSGDYSGATYLVCKDCGKEI